MSSSSSLAPLMSRTGAPRAGGERLAFAFLRKPLHRDPRRAMAVQRRAECRRIDLLQLRYRGAGRLHAAAPGEGYAGRGTVGFERHAHSRDALRVGHESERPRSLRCVIDAEQPGQVPREDRLEARIGRAGGADAQFEQSRARQHRMQSGIAAECEARTAVDEHGREAQEEEDIAQALLGYDGHAPARQRKGQGARVGIGRLGRCALREMAPAVFVPALGDLVSHEVRACDVLVRRGEIRLVRDGFAIGRDGFVPTPHRFEREPEVAVGLDPARIEAQRCAEFFEGRLRAARVAKEQSQVVVEIGNLRVQQQARAHPGFAIGDVAALPGEEPEVMGRDGVGRILRQHPAIVALGLVEAQLLVRREGPLKHSIDRGRARLELAVAILVAPSAAAGAGVVPAGRAHAGRKSRTRRASSRSSRRVAPSAVARLDVAARDLLGRLRESGPFLSHALEEIERSFGRRAFESRRREFAAVVVPGRH